MHNFIIPVKKLNSDAKLPHRSYSTDSGADIFSNEKVTIYPFRSELVKTDISLQIPKSTYLEKDNLKIIWEIQIRSKSGLASKQDLFVLNQPATIDNSYTGELKVILFNASEKTVEIKKGQKVAQIILCPVVIPIFVETEEEFNNEERNDKGFGSTGLN